MSTIERGFVSLPHGQIHFRRAGIEGDRLPLVMIHASPGSSKQLAGLIQALAGDRLVLAPDTAGNGDSDPLAVLQPSINDLAMLACEAINRSLDGRFQLYGSHTGASIAMEIAIAHPEQVDALVLDGIGLYAADAQAEILERYAREIGPDLEGTHLMKVWHFCRDQFLFWPYYNRTATGRLPNGLPHADTLHDFVVEVLKAVRSYHKSYRAAFRHPKRERLPQLTVPTLVASSPSDMLHEFADEVAALVPGAQRATLPTWDDAAYDAKAADFFRRFLDGSH
ncbi:MAG: alpha/beta hydrolase [Pseudomonadota bacterium]